MKNHSRNTGVSVVRRLLAALSLFLSIVVVSQVRVASQFVMRAQDPGVRGGPAGAGDALPRLTAGQTEYFTADATTSPKRKPSRTVSDRT